MYSIKLVTGLDTHSVGHLITLPVASSISYTLSWWGIQSLVHSSVTQWGYIRQSFSKSLSQSVNQSVRATKALTPLVNTLRALNRPELLLPSRDTQLGASAAFHKWSSHRAVNSAVFHKLFIALNSVPTLEQFSFGIRFPHGAGFFRSLFNTALSTADMKIVAYLFRFVFWRFRFKPDPEYLLFWLLFW